MRENDVAKMVTVAFLALIVIAVVVASCSVSGSGPAYQGPGIEIDVDGNKKTKPGFKTRPNYKAPSFKKR